MSSLRESNMFVSFSTLSHLEAQAIIFHYLYHNLKRSLRCRCSNTVFSSSSQCVIITGDSSFRGDVHALAPLCPVLAPSMLNTILHTGAKQQVIHTVGLVLGRQRWLEEIH